MTERERLIALLDGAEDLPICQTYEGFADYLLENGVIVPPCKVGDEVWFLYRLTEKYGGTRICKAKVVDLHYFTIDQLWWLRIVYDDINGHKDVTTALFGKLVFLTKEEAEQALKGTLEGKVQK